LLKTLLAVALAAAFASNPARADVEIGKSVSDFMLTDLNGKTHKLSGYKVAQALAAVKAGKPVPKATSQPYGCFVKY
jgi:hypothetical protein